MGAVDTEETRRVTGAAASEALPEVAGPALAPVAAVVPALAAGADTGTGRRMSDTPEAAAA